MSQLLLDGHINGNVWEILNNPVKLTLALVSDIFLGANIPSMNFRLVQTNDADHPIFRCYLYFAAFRSL